MHNKYKQRDCQATPVVSVRHMNARISIFLVSIFFPLLTQADEPKEYGCDVMYKEAGSDKTQVMEAPNFHMTDYNDENQLVKFQPPEGVKVTAIMCARSSIIPYKYDFMAIRAGYPLYIKSEDRLFVLELRGGQFNYRLLKGEPPSETEKIEIDAKMQYFQSRKEGA